MLIGYSVPTILLEIIKQAQNIGSEARWMEHYAHCQQNEDQIGAIEDTVFCIEESIRAIKASIEDLKGEEL
jgi:hypothetical protein